MGELLTYSIGVAIVLLPIYIVYKWLLANETFHFFNRIFILLSYVIALSAVPVMNHAVNMILTPAKITIGTLLAFDINTIMPVAGQSHTEEYITWLVFAYITGCIIMIFRSIFIWTKILRIIVSGKKQNCGRHTLVITQNHKIAPFSWFRYIVMTQDDYQQAGAMIITHETQHLKCHHWIDLLLAEMVIILNWFNPAAWLFREELKTVHEYQADMAVLNSGTDAKNYQLLLIKKAVGARFPSLANSLNHSKLKKRITMMLSKSSRKSKRLRALAAVPAIAVALTVVNQPMIAGTLSAISDSQLQIAKQDKGSENFSNSVMVSTSDSPIMAITTDETVTARHIEANEDLSGVDIFIDSEKSTLEKFNALPDSVKQTALVITMKDGSKKVSVKSVKTISRENMPTVYIDGEEVPYSVMQALDPNKIKSITVKKDNGNGEIHISLK